MSRYPDDDEKPPLFAFLDEWLKRIPFFVLIAMAIVGGFAGYFIAPHYGWMIPRQGAFVGASIGFIWLYALVALIRFTAWVVIIGLTLWFFYWLFVAPMKH